MRGAGIGAPTATLTPGSTDFADSATGIALTIGGRDGWRTSCLSSLRLSVGAGVRTLVVNTINNLYGLTTTSDLSFGLYVDGTWSSQRLIPSAFGWQRYGIGLDGSAHTLEIYAPYQQFDASTVGNVIGCWIQSIEAYGGTVSVSLPSGVTAKMVYYCDSIGCTGAANPGTQLGYIPRLRQVYPGRVIVEGWGGRSLWDDMPGGGSKYGFADLDALAARLVADVAGVTRRDIVLAIGENDYKGSKQTAAAYQTGLGSLLDKVHALDSGANLYVQTLTVTTDEATGNANGDTPPSFRTAATTAATGRGYTITVINGLNLMTSGGLSDFAHPSSTGHQAVYDGSGAFGSSTNLRAVFSV